MNVKAGRPAAPKLFLLALLCLGCRRSVPAQNYAPGAAVSPVYAAPSSEETIRIASFNIQIFGVSKMAKPEVAEILIDIVSRFDITAVQEVRSVDIEPVEHFMSLLPANYGYVIGPREGRSSSKEQYWVIYDTAKVMALEYETWNGEDAFERGPLGVYFKAAGGFDFILVNNHIKPGAAETEIRALPAAAAWFSALWKDPDVLLAGDFNADGSYFDEALLDSIFPETGYRSIITNEYDTTVAAGENTYDRIIITASALEDFTGAFGVVRFDEIYDFSRYSVTPRQVSDHYPVWAEFWTNRDTD